METSNNLNTSYDFGYSSNFDKPKLSQKENLQSGFTGPLYSLDNVFNANINLLDGMQCLAIIMFDMVNNNNALLLKSAGVLNAKRNTYNKLLLGSAQLHSAINNLTDFAAENVENPRFLDPLTSQKNLDDSFLGWAAKYFKVDKIIPENNLDIYKLKVGDIFIEEGLFQQVSLVDEDHIEHGAVGRISDITNKYNNRDGIISDDKLQGIVNTIKILQPSSDVTVAKLKSESSALSLSKLNIIANDAEQRLTYMNSINVQQGGLIQVAENNFQTVAQFASGIISVIKTMSGSFTQRM